MSASCCKRPSCISVASPETLVALKIVSIDHVAADGLIIWSFGYDILTVSPYNNLNRYAILNDVPFAE